MGTWLRLQNTADRTCLAKLNGRADDCGTIRLLTGRRNTHRPHIGGGNRLRRERKARENGKQGEQLAQHVVCQIAIDDAKSMPECVNIG